MRFGVALNYAYSDANLQSTIGAQSRIDTFQGALYASATYPRFFVDGIVAGGSASLDQTREGTFGNLHASPNAGLFTAVGRVGYLVPIGPVKVGPVGGLLYARTYLGGYSESGAAFYQVGYDRATVNSFYGQGGAEIRLVDPSFLLIDPFLTITYNRQFERGSGTSDSYLAFLPTQTLSGAAYAPDLDFVKGRSARPSSSVRTGTARSLPSASRDRATWRLAAATWGSPIAFSDSRLFGRAPNLACF